MFACIVEDATADNQNPYKSSRVGRSNQQATSSSEKRQQSSFEKYEEISGENRELKKRIKRMSLLVQETEGQRSTDRIIREQYAKDCDAKATAALMEKNTAHMIQLTQVRIDGFIAQSHCYSVHRSYTTLTFPQLYCCSFEM